MWRCEAYGGAAGRGAEQRLLEASVTTGGSKVKSKLVRGKNGSARVEIKCR
jgi:hypothetical protein